MRMRKKDNASEARISRMNLAVILQIDMWPHRLPKIAQSRAGCQQLCVLLRSLRTAAHVQSARFPVSSGAIWLSFLSKSGDDDKLRRKRTRARKQEFPRIFLRLKPEGAVALRADCRCSSMRERGGLSYPGFGPRSDIDAQASNRRRRANATRAW